MNAETFFRDTWKSRGLWAWLLWPVSLLYATVVSLRKWGYRHGILPVESFDVPVIVIGNLSVGGTGKTPLAIWAAKFLRSNGYTPGVISRGYGRDNPKTTSLVSETSDVRTVGDEPVLISRRTGVPVAVAHRRADAIRLLLRETDCDIFISDDGLQHLQLSSDLKIVVIDEEEKFGNGFLLPAGPLRESQKSLRSYDLQIVNGGTRQSGYTMHSELKTAINLIDEQQMRTLESFVDQPVIAYAGIGQSHKFFNALADRGISSTNISKPDHHRFSADDFGANAQGDTAVLMTEKDAVKCKQFAQPNWWYVAMDMCPDANFQEIFLNKIQQLTGRS